MSMLQKYFAITIVFLSLIAVPSLCVSGLLTHACDCEHDSDCGEKPGCDHESESGSDCEHEEDCPDDPCSVQVVRTDREAKTVDLELGVLGTVAFEVPADTQPAIASTLAFLMHHQSAPGAPYAPSDMPLLI